MNVSYHTCHNKCCLAPWPAPPILLRDTHVSPEPPQGSCTDHWDCGDCAMANSGGHRHSSSFCNEP
jgi:hypothetical protein